jgi:hypothetical protein
MAILRPDSFFPGWIVLLAIAGASSLHADWQPYQAHYDVYRNGKLIGKADVTLELQGDRWSMRSEAGGTRGLARLLGAKDNEYTEGLVHDGRFRPLKYSHQTRIAGSDNAWSASFDWQAGTVNIIAGKKGKDKLTLDMGAGALDALSLKLEMARRLHDNDSDMMFSLVDDDKIKQQAFHVLPSVYLDTGLGCLRTTPVERVRPDSTRYTRVWHAADVEFIAVRMEHGKTDGDQIEMRITELVVGQQQVQPQPGCVGPVK